MVSSSRRGLHGQVVDVLGQQIVLGTLEAGDLVDPQQIAEDLAVSRTVVREAVKVLTTKGLLDARPKRGTFVMPRAHWNLLDVDVMAWRDTDGPDERLLRELAEVRVAVEPVSARLAAERRDQEQLRELESALAEMVEAEDVADHVAADLRFHRALVASTGNELLVQVQALLEPALRARDLRTFQVGHGPEYLDAHAAVLGHIREGLAAEAFDAMRSLINESR